MNSTNKETLKEFGKAALLIILGLVVIITSAGVWNGVASHTIDSFYGWVAGLNLVAEGFGIWSLYKWLFKKKVEDKEKKDGN